MKWGRIILVIFGALGITALGIDAADTIRGADGTLLSRALRDEHGACPSGMRPIDNVPTLTCVDAYEASVGASCPESSPSQVLATQRNLEAPACASESKGDALPWRFVTREQASQLCARGGKRLPTSEEWHTLTGGMTAVESSCNVSSGEVSKGGAHASCVSPHEAYDLIGNVWEWVSDDVIGGVYKSYTLPASGYVSQVDQGGMATLTSENPDELYGKDYFWARTDGAYGIIRGGYYESGSDAGAYIVHADTPPNSASPGIGFRCVK